MSKSHPKEPHRKPPAKSPGPTRTKIVAVDQIERSIVVARGQKVLLAQDLAAMYGVPVKQLNRSVQRNRRRFPEDFMFQLTWEEAKAVRSQIVTLGRGFHFRYRPNVFTEHGAVMLASLLNSPLAIAASVEVVRAFVRLRLALVSSASLRQALEKVEKRLDQHDDHFSAVFDALRQLIVEADAPPKPKIGFATEKGNPHGQ